MKIKIYNDRWTDSYNEAGTQFEQNATTIKFDFSELDFLDDECVKTIHFFHDDLIEEVYYVPEDTVDDVVEEPVDETTEDTAEVA